MNCTACQAPNWDQARFCQGCGATLAQAGPPPAAPPQQVYAGQAAAPPVYPQPPQQGGWQAPAGPAQGWQAPQQQGWQAPQQGWGPPQQQPQQAWGAQSAWGNAGAGGVGINWQAVGYGAAAYAILIIIAFTTQFKTMVESYLQTGVAPSMVMWYVTTICLAATGGVTTIHYSKARSVIEAGLAGVVGNLAAVMILSMMNPTIQTMYGPRPYYTTDLGTIFMSTLITTAAAAGGGYWYANHLRQKGK